MATWTAAPFVPRSGSLRRLAKASRTCQGCPLYEDAIQTVFGEGPSSARIVLVGEQPGDQEDRQGEPFVGPAGRVLWRCVDEAGLDRADLYVTNAVKHFKHEDRGKRRLHKKPTAEETEACHPWLEAELTAVRPRVVVALGATAARALLGRTVGIAASRGEVFDAADHPVLITYHPSAILRATEQAGAIRQDLVADLAAAGKMRNMPPLARSRAEGAIAPSRKPTRGHDEPDGGALFSSLGGRLGRRPGGGRLGSGARAVVEAAEHLGFGLTGLRPERDDQRPLGPAGRAGQRQHRHHVVRIRHAFEPAQGVQLESRARFGARSPHVRR